MAEYNPLTVELDEDRALVHGVDETDFQKIVEAINNGADNDAANDIGQFHGAWALIVELWSGENRFVAFSKVKGGWNIKQSKTLGSWVFNEGRFEKVQQQKVFSFRNVFDFICFNGGNVFVRNKANYELGLNIREGLIQKRDELIEAFAENGILASADDLKVAVGTNKTLLRRLVSVEENRYFEDQEFIEGMKTIINEHDWDLEEDENGCFVIDENNVDLFLKLINDKRFLSLIRKQMVDSDIVEPVET